MTTGKTVALTVWTFVGRVTSLLFDTLSRFVIALLSSHSMAAVAICSDSGAQEEEIHHYFHLFPSVYHKVMGPGAVILVFFVFSFKLALSLSSFTLSKRFFSVSSLSSIRVVSSAYLRWLMFLPPS